VTERFATLATVIGGTSTRTQSDPARHGVRFSDDPWGERRDPLTWTGKPSPAQVDNGGPDGRTPRGFTGHEMLDDLGLVHMTQREARRWRSPSRGSAPRGVRRTGARSGSPSNNGRIYDAQLGRFLSADVLVQYPGNLQSFNRYSYVHNTPLSFTDPSGFTRESDDLNQNQWDYINQITRLTALPPARVSKQAPAAKKADTVKPNTPATTTASGSAPQAPTPPPTAAPADDNVTLVTQNADGSAQAADVPAKEVAAVVAEEAAKKTDETAANTPAQVAGQPAAAQQYPVAGPAPKGCTVGVVQNLYWNKGVTVTQTEVQNAVGVIKGVPGATVGVNEGVSFDHAKRAINEQLALLENLWANLHRIMGCGCLKEAGRRSAWPPGKSAWFLGLGRKRVSPGPSSGRVSALAAGSALRRGSQPGGDRPSGNKACRLRAGAPPRLADADAQRERGWHR
jgi:RHS repeat-associated protein